MVAKNHCLMRIREKQGRKISEINEKTSVTADEETDRHKLLEDEKALSLMEEAIDELNDEQRRCVTLFYLQKKSYQEIGEITGFSLLQVKSYIQNGKRNLKLMIEKKLQNQAGRSNAR
jgi:RNA polymerase sigma-70 factor (ECF subfamily)